MTDITTITTITTFAPTAPGGVDLYALISRDTPLRRTAATNGGEYSGPCPLCRRGTDHFKYWRGAHGRGERWACLGPKAGRSGCDKGGDAIQYLRDRDHLTYPEARARLGLTPPGGVNRRGTRSGGNNLLVAPIAPSAGPCAPPPLTPPNPAWQTRATQFAARCALLLWEDEGRRALDYLHRRGIADTTLRAFHIGYNPEDLHDDHAAWGLPPPAPPNGVRRRIWLPRGITFPWYIDAAPGAAPAIWRLNIRRPLTPAQIARGEPKYLGPPGFANALYNAGALGADPATALPAVLVEGELDALTIVQAAGDLVVAVATGSTAGARRLQWLARLAQAPRVLVAFDVDDQRRRRRRCRLVARRPPPCPPLAPPPPRRQLRPRPRRRPRLDPVRPKPLTDRSHSPCPPNPANHPQNPRANPRATSAATAPSTASTCAPPACRASPS